MSTNVKVEKKDTRARDLMIVRFGFLAFAKVCFLISLHVGFFLGLLFWFTNGGRRVSFGTYQFFGLQADLVGFLFLILVITLLIGVVGILSYVPINGILRLTGGVKIRGTETDTDDGGPVRS